MEEMSIYLSGQKLFGDDFSPNEIEQWHKDEMEGYAELGAKNRESYRYVYHALNSIHGFRPIENRRFDHALGLGSAYGDEFLPIIEKIGRLTISDPSDAFVQDQVHGVPCKYVKPSVDGMMPFQDGAFDLITCFGVLHHIPNVTAVVNEISRCLAKEGIVLIREPIVSMGDWTKPRPGLTRRERGIPMNLFEAIIKKAGFKIMHQSLCVFSPIPRIFNRLGVPAYNSKIVARLDRVLSLLFKWNLRYHADGFFLKIRPSSVYFVLSKA